MEARAGPAEYLFQNPKYHDCYLTVGDPDTGDVEKIGVSVRHLAAHSTVFREMLVDSDLADPTGENTNITDISPEVFRLMLTHVYGGRLPTVSLNIAVELLICADKYDIKELVCLTCGLLKPESVDQVFPALRCVAYITKPDLEARVKKIVQEQTRLIINHKQFLELDDISVEYITKQEKLAITEVDLWNALVKWGKVQTQKGLQLRQILMKPLKNIRLLTLTQDEFITEVLHKNVLCPEEAVNILKAISSNGCLNSGSFCTSKTKRAFYKIEAGMSQTKHKPTSKGPAFTGKKFVGSPGWGPEEISSNEIMDPTYPGIFSGQYTRQQWQKKSYFTVTVRSKDIQILTFNCDTQLRQQQTNEQNYNLICNITVVEMNKGFCSDEKYNIAVDGLVVYSGQVDIPIKVNQEYLILKAETSYHFELNFAADHPVYKTEYKQKDITYLQRGNSNMYVKFDTPFHVKQITYNV